ncbi:coniferyl-alcohol dehydrogenase [Marinobacterium aestuariivivens]|uniref:Coniferyl-alcohol dehydrogenase n=1 Tax=Marinobacterium aestuariivivens TaxID=1698799 RepID=A0ABW2AA13_9GAMM
MNNSNIVVTGAANGVGAELCKLLRSRGHRVTGLDIAEPKYDLDAFIRVDLSSESSIAAALEQLDGPIDGLCNVAGVPPRQGLETTILQVNFLGLRRFTYGLMDKLKEGASIVNLASRAGYGWREAVDQVKRLAAVRTAQELETFIRDENIDPARAYNLSKEAVILWTQAETEALLARGLRMNSVSPGAVATDILDDFSRAFGDKMARNVERAGRPGTPEEVAEVAAFLLSPASGWMKGVDIPLDGGMGAFNLSDALELSALRLS